MFLPVTDATADDLERFSGRYGTFRWCSCMRWRLRSADFRDRGKQGRVTALAERVRAGEPVGILPTPPTPAMRPTPSRSAGARSRRGKATPPSWHRA